MITGTPKQLVSFPDFVLITPRNTVCLRTRSFLGVGLNAGDRKYHFNVLAVGCDTPSVSRTSL